MIIVHVVDISIIRTSNELTKTIDCLKKEFEIKDFGRTKFCLELQIMYLNKMFVNRETYIMKVFKRFYVDELHSLCSPVIVRLLIVNRVLFRP